MARSIAFVLLLVCAFFVSNCTEPPPLPPGTEPGKTPTDVKLPGDDGPVPETLKKVATSSLPRQALAVFLHDGMAFSCTPEGSLYNKKIGDIKSFEITATDLSSGEKRWSYKGSSCAFRSAGSELIVARYLENKGAQLQFDRLDAKTGKRLGGISLNHTGCSDIQVSGPGERLFAFKSNLTHSCYDFAARDGKLLVTSEASVRLLDLTSGKQLWSYANNDTIRRIAGATIHEGTAYIVEGLREVAKGAVALPLSAQVKAASLLQYEIRAVDVASGESKWVAGPLGGIVLSATLTIHNGALIAQVMSSESTMGQKGDHITALYGPTKWSGHVRYYSLNPKTGESNWRIASALPFQKADKILESNRKDYWLMPLPVLPAPVAMETGLVMRMPNSVQLISASTGQVAWSRPSNDHRISHAHAITSQHLHLRSSHGSATLMELIPKEAPKVTRGSDIGGLLYAADGIAPGTSPKASGQAPKTRVSTKGYCLKFNGEPVPMEKIRNGTRFFLPPANHYYTPASFFTAFCANYLIDVFGYGIHQTEGKELWKSRALIPEAPAFYFIRGNSLFILSDNGEWYVFAMR